LGAPDWGQKPRRSPLVSAQAPGSRVRMHVDAALEGLDVLSGHNVYCVVQKATTNVLRHARAKTADISASVEGGQISCK
jgi:signal transduction histidine kinase